MDILLVEDNPGDARLAKEAFRHSKAPVTLHIVGDGVDAMSFLRRQGVHVHAPRPHLILLDLNLPALSGRETLSLIKNDDSFKEIPTVILTTSDSEEDISYCYKNYANCYVRKPTRWDAFGEVVKHVNDVWLGMALLPARER
jgi:chemotaxis family two-component system response regulator Rcp1